MRIRLTLDIERKPKPEPRAEVQSSQWEEGPPVYNLGSAATEPAASASGKNQTSPKLSEAL